MTEKEAINAPRNWMISADPSTIKIEQGADGSNHLLINRKDLGRFILDLRDIWLLQEGK